jgi:cystathionine beta-lyase/cystathionine gamma-synthase
VRLKEDSREAVYKFMNALRLCTRAASVGDIFTGIVHPATATHREMSPARRAKLGISEGLLRVSAGIEEVEDIIADIKQAFELGARTSLSAMSATREKSVSAMQY